MDNLRGRAFARHPPGSPKHKSRRGLDSASAAAHVLRDKSESASIYCITVKLGCQPRKPSGLFPGPKTAYDLGIPAALSPRSLPGFSPLGGNLSMSLSRFGLARLSPLLAMLLSLAIAGGAAAAGDPPRQSEN